MKHLYILFTLSSLSVISYATEVTFHDIQKRTTVRNEITNAIIKIDTKLRFSLTIQDDLAKVKIWKHMKVADPNAENYTFQVTPEIRQEYERLQLQKELDLLTSKADFLERKFRVAKYKQHKVFFNMPLEDAVKILGADFTKSGSKAEFGSVSLTSQTHIIEFRGNRIHDIKTK